MDKLTIIGNLGQDPEMRYTPIRSCASLGLGSRTKDGRRKTNLPFLSFVLCRSSSLL